MTSNLRQFIALAALALAAPATSAADSVRTAIDSTDVFYRHLQLQEVIVTGPTGNTRLRQSPVSINVIDAAALHSTGSANLLDAIAATTPGVSTMTTGGSIAKPIIRGLGGTRVVTVYDGIRQEGHQWGDEHGVEIDANAVGTVEVLKGPGSLMYGSDAMGGVIKFNPYRTPAEGTRLLSLDTEYRSNNNAVGYSARFAANHRGWLADWRHSARWAQQYNTPIGRMQGTQFNEQTVNGLLGVNRAWGHTHLKFAYYNITPSIPEGETAPCRSYHFTLPYQRVTHYKATLNQSLYLGKHRLNLLLAYQNNHRREFEEEPDEAEMALRLHTINYSAAYTFRPADRHTINAGINGMWQHNLNHGEEFLIPNYRLFDIGYYATWTGTVDRVDLSAGARMDHRHLHTIAVDERFETLKRDYTGASWSVGGVWHAGSHVNVRLNYSHGFRAPTVNELTANGVHEGTIRYEVGNNALKTERNNQVDLGIDYTSGTVEAQLSLFLNDVDNYIFARRVDRVIDPLYLTYEYTQGHGRLYGGEARVDWHPLHSLHLGTSLAMVEGRLLHHSGQERYLPMIPATCWKADVKYEFNHHGRTLCNTFVALNVASHFKQSHYCGIGDTESATPAYTLLGASVGTELHCGGRHIASLRLIADNITNKRYVAHTSRLKHLGMLNPGFNLTVRLSVPLTF